MSPEEQTMWRVRCHQLAMGYNIEYRARGNSMRPTIPDGAMVKIAPVVSPRMGDMVLAWNGEKAVVHRVVGCNNSHVWIKGDRADRIDRFHRAQIMGRVITVNGTRTDGRFALPKNLMYVVLSLLHPVLKSIFPSPKRASRDSPWQRPGSNRPNEFPP